MVIRFIKIDDGANTLYVSEDYIRYADGTYVKLSNERELLSYFTAMGFSMSYFPFAGSFNFGAYELFKFPGNAHNMMRLVLHV